MPFSKISISPQISILMSIKIYLILKYLKIFLKVNGVILHSASSISAFYAAMNFLVKNIDFQLNLMIYYYMYHLSNGTGMMIWCCCCYLFKMAFPLVCYCYAGS